MKAPRGMNAQTAPSGKNKSSNINPTERARTRETPRATLMADDASPKPKKLPAKKRKSAGRVENLTNAGIGRPKGVPNKTTAILKDAILKAAEKAGKRYGNEGMVSYLEAQAIENPGPFMSLLGKVLPMQVVGDADNPLMVVHRIELVAPSGK